MICTLARSLESAAVAIARLDDSIGRSPPLYDKLRALKKFCACRRMQIRRARSTIVIVVGPVARHHDQHFTQSPPRTRRRPSTAHSRLATVSMCIVISGDDADESRVDRAVANWVGACWRVSTWRSSVTHARPIVVSIVSRLIVLVMMMMCELMVVRSSCYC